MEQDKELLDLSQNEGQNQAQSSEQNQSNQNESAKPKQATSKKAEKLPVDEAEYNEYTALKFLEFSGTKLKDETTARIKELEAKLKSCAGSRPIRTVRAAIKNEQVLLVEGVPVPESVLAIIKNSQTENYYLGE